MAGPGVQAWSVFGTIGLDGLGKTQAELQAFDALGARTAGRLSSLESSSLLLASGFTAVGAAAAAAAAAAIRSFQRMDDKLTESLAILDNVSDATREKMRAAAEEVARTTTASATDAAQAYFYLESAGLDAKQSIAALPQAAAFAQAGNFSLAQATTLAADAQAALGLKSKDAQKNLRGLTRVTDVLVKANTQANASVEQFSEALTNKAGARLRATNKTIEEGVAALAAYADQGVKGSIAGQRLNILLRDLPEAAAQNADAFEKFGISIFDASGSLKSIPDIIDQFDKAMGDMSPRQQAVAFHQMQINKRLADSITMLLGTSDKMRRYQKELEQAGGTTQRVADNQLKSVNKQLGLLGDKLGSLFRGFASGTRADFLAPLEHMNAAVESVIETWNSMTGAFTDSESAIGGVLDNLATWIEENRRGIVIFFAQVRLFFAEMGAVFRTVVNALEIAVKSAIGAILAGLEVLGKGWNETLGRLPGVAQFDLDALHSAFNSVTQSIAGDASDIGDAWSHYTDVLGDTTGVVSRLEYLTDNYTASLHRNKKAAEEAGKAGKDAAEAAAGAGGPVSAKFAKSVLTGPTFTGAQGLKDIGQNAVLTDFGNRMKVKPIPPPLLSEKLIPKSFQTYLRDRLERSEQEAFAQSNKNLLSPRSAAMRGANQLGRGLIQGIASGSLDAKQLLMSAMTTVLNIFLPGAGGGLFSMLGIFSPSRVTMHAGHMLMEGLRVGIEDNVDRVRESVQRAADQSLAPMQDAVRRQSELQRRMRQVLGIGGPAAAPARQHERRLAGQFGAALGASFREGLSRMPPPTDPRQAARDRAWKGFLGQSIDALREDGRL